VLSGRRKRERIPFLRLWEAPEEVRRPPKKAVEPPPLGVALLLLATLSGILAAAGPMWRVVKDGGRVMILIDRGASMSATSSNGESRFIENYRAVAAELGRLGPIRPQYRAVPQTDAEPAKMTRTTADTAAELQAVVRSLSKDQPVVVVSDRELDLPPKGAIVQVLPASAVRSAGITLLAVRQGQVMIRLRTTDAAGRTVRVSSGEKTVERRVDVKAGADTDVFVEMPAPGEIVEAALVEADDFDGDDRAWVVRPATWPAVAVWTAIPDELRRMLEVYAKHRPAGRGARTLSIVRAGDALAAGETAVILSPTTLAESAGAVTVTDHPIVRGLDLSRVSGGLSVAQTPPGEGWAVVARVGEKPIVAVREVDGVRRAWVGFESKGFARTADYVMFWTKLLDWTGAGSEEYVPVGVGEIPAGASRVTPDKLPGDVDPRHWPGVFRTADGLVAANAAPVVFNHDPKRAWRDELSRLPTARGGGIPLRPWLALAALVLGLAASLTWEKARRRVSGAAPAASGAPFDAPGPHVLTEP
jgi:hypothetical protein